VPVLNKETVNLRTEYSSLKVGFCGNGNESVSCINDE
jgi:hypothetical protein